jgi:hypothetical protein
MNAVKILPINEAIQPRTPLLGNNSGRVIRKTGKNGYFVACALPVESQLHGSSGRRAHLGRKILGDIENFHVLLVVAHLENTLIGKCLDPLDTTALILLPSLGIFAKHAESRKPMHDAELHNMQPMVKRTRDHLQPRS